jgi:hypothetical protein
MQSLCNALDLYWTLGTAALNLAQSLVNGSTERLRSAANLVEEE